MEPNKLEKQIQEKLNSREIQPTDMAWDRLDAMLAVTENKEPKQKNYWWYIAASFIGLCFISTLFLFQNKTGIESPKNEIVIEKTISKESPKPDDKKSESKNIISNPRVQVENKAVVLLPKTNSTPQKQSLPPQTIDNKVVANPKLAQNETAITLKNPKTDNVDQLLASVESNSKSNTKTNSVKVNSSTLLNQVDGELQVSFREKAFNTISKKYKEAKEALANRNNE